MSYYQLSMILGMGQICVNQAKNHSLCDSNKLLYTGMDTGPVDPQVGSGLVAYKRCAKSMGKPKI